MLERTPEGDVLVRLSPEERSLLLGLAGELRAQLEGESRDPSLRRLFPPAYDDQDDERAYRELAGDELLSGRRQALELLAATARSDRLSADEADAWLRALNDLRLVLGTRLDVQEDMLIDRPKSPEHALYIYLSWLQEQLVAALAPTESEPDGG
ncbi:MAG: DUF2017 family protein [Actinobacteria bacterium]|nr:MAG: DUF2017 family protein [Actinomycetota bacterium]